jgi:hypothetical protein
MSVNSLDIVEQDRSYNKNYNTKLLSNCGGYNFRATLFTNQRDIGLNSIILLPDSIISDSSEL